jgi:hypothetical protein
VLYQALSGYFESIGEIIRLLVTARKQLFHTVFGDFYVIT